MIEGLNWDKGNGLLPVIVQDERTHQVLMLGYMNLEAFSRTLETQQVTFYSRTKQRLWMKGETSGHVLKVVRIIPDCDKDTLLILARIQGPCCHLNQRSCFGVDVDILSQLEETIVERKQERPDGNYTTQLFEAGIQRIAQKVGEEGVEVALAGVCGERAEIVNESADLLFHLLILLAEKQISFAEVLDELRSRSIQTVK